MLNPSIKRKYDVIFSLDMLDDIFGVFSTMFSGKSAVDGVNPYREKIVDGVYT